ncbi:ribosome maturation factor RimM [Mobiluncus mulieris]|uniref:ribosome maturation factor RimM n=1 Tax=Mobiluncus mulieris TaxID=2052 RepID=UPI001470185F|nr:ribosome maturation factor RimM [Mobiluncus mulieris]MCU9997093.1 ribosome maturation factor RimM [Mobiluncus mulieris]MCV0009830.1 ribosome maturation factor RimM [Mobiluncus mulieris]NMW61038.1 ribosome maturation factor RimM [Mobiluncus mulieris]
MKVTVATLGRASGVRGEIRVALRTDNPHTRFAPGAVLVTDHPDFPRLTVKQARHSGKHFVASFKEIPDRDTAETLGGVKLVIETDPEATNPPGPDETPGATESGSEDGFYRHELVGLSAQTQTGESLGMVSDLIIGTAQDLLEVTTAEGHKVLIPFVFELVPEVDLAAGRVVMAPPGGLFPDGTQSKQAEDSDGTS